MEHLNVRNCNGQYNSIGLAVPLRGLGFLTQGGRKMTHEEYTEFPSPHGDYGS